MTFTFDINGYVGQNAEQVREDLATYYADPDNPTDGFTGRHFDALSASSNPNKFTARDVAAVAALSVPLRGRTVSQLLFDHADELNQQLRACPGPGATLWGVKKRELADDSSLARLYSSLRALDQVGKVRASKLLACKRPGLVPVRDSVVERLLGAGDRWWMPMREAFEGGNLAKQLRKLGKGVVPRYVSELRVLDVALWMHGNRQQTQG